MDAEYGARYAELYRRHWWWRARERVILDALHRHQPRAGWHNILDVGCGDGLLFDELEKLSGAQLVEGVEPAAALVSPDTSRRARIHVQPFDASFDFGRRYSLILMLDVLEHLSDPSAALRHATELLEPDGILLATVPSLMSLWTRHDDHNHHYIRYDKAHFRALVTDAGLCLDECRYFFHWMVAAKLATRLKEALIPGKPLPPSVPPSALNEGIYALSRLEERVMALLRLRMPFGSSLLAVGHRQHDYLPSQ
jgi:2-polyprenyl-3-methyl-5-hydroxy-6-metoxy-1,4-benzoquinol methylase